MKGLIDRLMETLASAGPFKCPGGYKPIQPGDVRLGQCSLRLQALTIAIQEVEQKDVASCLEGEDLVDMSENCSKWFSQFHMLGHERDIMKQMVCVVMHEDFPPLRGKHLETELRSDWQLVYVLDPQKTEERCGHSHSHSRPSFKPGDN